MKPTPQFIFYGHHKCASSAINRFLWRATAALGKSFESFHSDEQAGGCIREAAEQKKLEIVSIRNARRDHAELFPEVKGLHLIRDPRDVLVSAYFSHLKTHRLIEPEMAEERERLSKLDKDDGLVATMDGMTGRTLQEMADWDYGARADILEWRLEDLSGNWLDGLREMSEHAGLLRDYQGRDNDSKLLVLFCNLNKLSHRVLRRRLLRRDRLADGEFVRLADGVSFSKLSGGRKPGQTNESSHYRKGQAGDWGNHFTPKVAGAFQERFPDLAAKLGYESGESVNLNDQ